MGRLYRADVAYHGSGGEERRGRQAAIDFAATYKDAFPDFFGYVEQIVAEDDFVVSRVRTFGTNTGPVMGMPPRGRRVEIRWVMTMVRVQSGQIVEEWEVFDQLDYMRQLGVVP
jgi:predicted ester cyclase